MRTSSEWEHLKELFGCLWHTEEDMAGDLVVGMLYNLLLPLFLLTGELMSVCLFNFDLFLLLVLVVLSGDSGVYRDM